MLPPEECKAPVGQVFIPLPLMNPERLVASLTLHRAKFKNEVQFLYQRLGAGQTEAVRIHSEKKDLGAGLWVTVV